MAGKPSIPDFPTLPDFGQMITQACEVVTSVRGIPYDFNGTLSLENKFVVLFKTVKEMFDAQDELVKSYKALYDFVNNYFDNLDVQEEINKKIDEMSNNGELNNILNSYVLGFIFAENFGAKGDGVNDDTISLQKAIDEAIKTHKTLMLQSGKIYLTNQLNINGVICLDLNNATIKSTSEKCLVFSNLQNKASFIKNGTIDCNNISTAFYGTFKTIYISNISILNPNNIGCDFSNMYEVYMSNCYMYINKENECIGIRTRADNSFNTILLRGFKIALDTVGTSRFYAVHAWIDNAITISGSIYCNNAKGNFTNCFSDTYEVAFVKTSDSNLIINEHLFHCNSVFYTLAASANLPSIFKFSVRNNSRNVQLTNCRVNNFVLSETAKGFTFSDLAEEDLLCVTNLLSPFVNNMPVNRKIKIDLATNNTGSAYAIVGSETTTIIFNITVQEITGNYTALFTLPEWLMPYDITFIPVIQRNSDNLECKLTYIRLDKNDNNVVCLNKSNGTIFSGNISYPSIRISNLING